MAKQSSKKKDRKAKADRRRAKKAQEDRKEHGRLINSIGPKLENIKAKYPDRNDLIAILTDETKRNPLTVMPPSGRNRILSEREINAVVDFLQTL